MSLTLAEANQVVFFNAGEGYRISHPVAGGDASLSVSICEEWLRELAPRERVGFGARFTFRGQRLRVDDTASRATLPRRLKPRR